MTVNSPTSIRLITGGYINLANPSPEDIHFEDISGALSKICRFGGQIREFYSVAEHLVLCAGLAEHHGMTVEVQRAVLMHDAEEAYLGDVVSPLKSLLPTRKEMGDRMELEIGRRFGINFHLRASEIKLIDFSMILAERNAMFDHDGMLWVGEETMQVLAVPDDYLPRGWYPDQAQNAFTSVAKKLGIDVHI